MLAAMLRRGLHQRQQTTAFRTCLSPEQKTATGGEKANSSEHALRHVVSVLLALQGGGNSACAMLAGQDGQYAKQRRGLQKRKQTAAFRTRFWTAEGTGGEEIDSSKFGLRQVVSVLVALQGGVNSA